MDVEEVSKIGDFPYWQEHHAPRYHFDITLTCQQDGAPKMKKISAVIIAALIAVTSASAFAHSGGTDSKGCHRNHKTGDYHCH
nr:YHYH domain-containing protein [Stutzerimonas stutzeri]